VTGLKFKNNVKGLNEAIELFETMDRKILSDNAYDEYLKKYSSEINYKMLKNIYDSL
jgi:3-phenylpropionate/cinnamic acid dioxygenase small subunit